MKFLYISTRHTYDVDGNIIEPNDNWLLTFIENEVDCSLMNETPKKIHFQLLEYGEVRIVTRDEDEQKNLRIAVKLRDAGYLSYMENEHPFVRKFKHLLGTEQNAILLALAQKIDPLKGMN